MLWIQNYLSEVGRYLPAAERDDILAELGASLAEQARDLAGDQPPNSAQQQQVIDRMGHPLKVASSYDRQRYLIGPELYPTFLEVLKIVLLVVAVIQATIILTAYVAAGAQISLGGLAKGIVESLMYAGAMVLAVFATSEYFGEKLNYYDQWRASSLQPDGNTHAIARGDLVTNLASEAGFLLWWNGALTLQNWIPGTDGDWVITLSDAWQALYWPLNILCGAWFVLHAAVFIRGIWRPATLWLEIALGSAGLATAGWLLSQAPLAMTSGSVESQSTIIVQRVVFAAVLFVAGVILWDILLAAKRLRARPIETLHLTEPA